MTLLKLLAGALGAVMAAASVMGLLAVPGLAIAVCPFSMLGFLYVYEHGEFSPGFRLSFLMQSHFILAGILAVAGAYVFI